MREEDIHIGDRLRIRQWDDMELEFGLTARTRSIRCTYRFTKKMRYLCGRPFTIMAKEEDGYISEEGEEYSHLAPSASGRWKISADMLEPIEEPVEITPFTDDEMRLLLGI